MDKLTLQMKMVIVFLVIGFLFDLVSFATPYWNDHGSETWGLWQQCTDDGCVSIDTLTVLQDGMKVGRACEVLGMACYIVLVVCVSLYIFWKRTIRLLSIAVVVAFLTLFSILIGAVMWSTSSNTTLYWCYYFCYFSGLAVSAAGGVLIHCRRQDLLTNIEKSHRRGNFQEDV